MPPPVPATTQDNATQRARLSVKVLSTLSIAIAEPTIQCQLVRRKQQPKGPMQPK